MRVRLIVSSAVAVLIAIASGCGQTKEVQVAGCGGPCPTVPQTTVATTIAPTTTKKEHPCYTTTVASTEAPTTVPRTDAPTTVALTVAPTTLAPTTTTEAVVVTEAPTTTQESTTTVAGVVTTSSSVDSTSQATSPRRQATPEVPKEGLPITC